VIEKSRVKLCVDACDGFTDEGLSQCLADGDTLLSRLEGWQLACMDSDAKVESLTAQRDELLAALKYHQDQTRPIQATIDLIAKCEAQS